MESSIANRPFANSLLARDPIVPRHQLSLALWFLGCVMLAGTANVGAMPSLLEVAQTPVIVDALSGGAKLAQPRPAPAPARVPAQPPTSPSPAQAPAAEPVGNVAT